MTHLRLLNAHSLECRRLYSDLEPKTEVRNLILVTIESVLSTELNQSILQFLV